MPLHDDPETARLFIGLWPDEAALQALLAHQAAWHWGPQAARVAPGRLHMTLHFLGDVARDRIAALRAALQEVPAFAFELEWLASKCWHGGLAVLEARPGAGLLALHQQVGECLAGLGYTLERRPFKPHVTLARKAQGSQPPASLPAAPWRAASLALVESARPTGQYLPLWSRA